MVPPSYRCNSGAEDQTGFSHKGSAIPSLGEPTFCSSCLSSFEANKFLFPSCCLFGTLLHPLLFLCPYVCVLTLSLLPLTLPVSLGFGTPQG